MGNTDMDRQTVRGMCWYGVLGVLCAWGGLVEGAVRVEPAAVRFDDPFARRQLVVSAEGRDVTRQATYVSRQPEVVSIDGKGYANWKSAGVRNH
jgi:hypothetical protein